MAVPVQFPPAQLNIRIWSFIISHTTDEKKEIEEEETPKIPKLVGSTQKF